MPSSDLLQRVLSLYEGGRYVSAYRTASSDGAPPLTWTEPRARLLAARVMRNLGGTRAARHHVLKAYRQDPRDPEVAYYAACELTELRGPLATLAFVGRAMESGLTPGQRGQLLLARAEALATLRDFDRADEAWREAEALTTEHPWALVVRASILEAADRMPQALEVSRRALDEAPLYRPAIQEWARLVENAGRRDEAIAFLAEKAGRLEAPYLHLQHAQMLGEAERFDEAHAAFARAVAGLLCAEEPLFRQLAAMRAYWLHRQGRDRDAAALGRWVGHEIHDRIAERVAAGVPWKRVCLPVPYVRQDHKTCAPATLASIAAYWRLPADHVSIAEEICVDGTPAASERRWAEGHGFVTRELRVTWDATLALIDAGIPFTLTTVGPASAHLQAVVGYDLQRRAFVIRDPSTPNLVEIDAEGLLADQAFAGPRGMALVPRPEAARLTALTLPESTRYDHLHALQAALLVHDRVSAQRERQALAAEAPDSEVTAFADRGLAHYDANQPALLAVYEEQLRRHPKSSALLLWRTECLRGLARRDARLSELRRLAHDDEPEPLFQRAYAGELVDDARYHTEAEDLARSALRKLPQDAGGYEVLAALHGHQRRFAEAADLARFASCLDPLNELTAFRAFWATRLAGDPEAGLAFLRRRAEQWAARSAEPLLTVVRALDALSRSQEALALMEQGLSARPEDGSLSLFAAQTFLRIGEAARSQALLEAARGKVREVDWLRAATAWDIDRGDLNAAADKWRLILQREPLDVEAHAALTQLLAETQGREVARAYVEEAVRRHPFFAPLARLAIEQTDSDGPDALDVVRRLVAISPSDAWARRELALRLARTGAHEAALQELAAARAIEPESSLTFAVEATLRRSMGDAAGATQAYRAALSRSADHESAFWALLDLAATRAERNEVLAFFQSEIRRQTIFGASLEAFRCGARGLLDDADLRSFLREACEARPDLAETWIALARQVASMDQADEALHIARAASERFPHDAEVALLLADMCERRGDRRGCREALERALAFSPRSSPAARRLAEISAQDGELARSKELLLAAIVRDPLEVRNRGVRAAVLWRAGERQPALDEIQHALRVSPDYPWAWDRLAEWSAALDQRRAAEEFARSVRATRPFSGWAAAGLAELLPAHKVDERIALLEEAARLAPDAPEIHDQRAVCLAGAGRLDEALAACRPPAWGETPPFMLRGRAAWVLGQRRDRTAAIAAMTQVAADDPGYEFAWGCLAAWHREEGSWAKARDAYATLYRLDPFSESAAFGLFDMHINLGEIDEAAALLADCRVKLRTISNHVAAVILACLRQQRREAEEAFVSLAAALGDGEEWALQSAADTLIGHKLLAPLRRGLDRAARAPSAHPSVLALWARRARFRSPVAVWWTLRRWAPAPDRLDEILPAYLQAMADSGRDLAWMVFAGLARRWMRASDRVWIAAATALATMGFPRLAARWLGDAGRRPALTPAMLRVAALTLRCGGREPEGVALTRRALELPPDASYAHHQAWATFDEARDALIEQARRRMEAVRASSEDDEVATLALDHAEVVLLARDPELPRRERAGRARARLRELSSRFVARSGLPAATYLRRATRRLLRRALADKESRHEP